MLKIGTWGRFFNRLKNYSNLEFEFGIVSRGVKDWDVTAFLWQIEILVQVKWLAGAILQQLRCTTIFDAYMLRPCVRRYVRLQGRRDGWTNGRTRGWRMDACGGAFDWTTARVRPPTTGLGRLTAWHTSPTSIWIGIVSEVVTDTTTTILAQVILAYSWFCTKLLLGRKVRRTSWSNW